MKSHVIAAIVVLCGFAANAEPMHHTKPVQVPSGLYYQKLSFAELRGVEINSKTKTAQWVDRSCDVVFNTCQESRSKSVPVKYNATSIEIPTVPQDGEASQVITFYYSLETKSLFQPSQGDYFKEPEILKLTK